MSRINLIKLKLATAQAAISTAALTGLIALMLGGASCLAGLTGVATIKLAKLLSPHRTTLKIMMFYGSASVGAGLFCIGTGMAIAKYIYEPMEVEELLLEENQHSAGEFEVIAHIPNVCVGCNNFHGRTYNGVRLVCAIYPYGWSDRGQCPDWEHKPSD